MFSRLLRLTTWAFVGGVAAYQLGYKPWRRQWQASTEDSTKPLPGDDLVPVPQFNQTIGLTIAASPSAIWPWLVQMGYGRAGWYSYDAMDMLGKSSRDVRPELQDILVDQVIPIGPGFGFRVATVDHERALVLFGDRETMDRQEQGASEPAETSGLRFVGMLSDANMRDFQVSWAFVLEPTDDGRTRLLERFRSRTTPGPAAAVVTPIIDVGHFLMTRKHMLGVKERAESFTGSAPEPAAEVVAT